MEQRTTGLLAKFGIFQFDLARLRLTRNALPVRLPPQPGQILRLLVENQGQVVTREKLRDALWPAGTFVEFEVSLNAAVNRLRRALNDSADQPLYIETLPRVGYRFIAPVTLLEIPSPIPSSEPATTGSATTGSVHTDSATLQAVSTQTAPADPAPAAPLPTAPLPTEGQPTAALLPVEPLPAAPLPAQPLPAQPLPAQPLAPSPQPPTSPSPFSRSLPTLALSLLALAVLGLALWFFLLRRPTGLTTQEISINLPPGAMVADLAIAPQGDHLAFVQLSPAGSAVYRRFFHENFFRRVENADGARLVFFSPDGKDLGLVTPTEIRLVTPDGRSRTLTTLDGSDIHRILWNPADNAIYYALVSKNSGIWRLPASGGLPPELVVPHDVQPSGVEYPLIQSVHGRQLLYTVRRGPGTSSIHLRGPDGKKVTLVQPALGGLSGGGALVYQQGRNLLAKPFSLPSSTSPTFDLSQFLTQFSALPAATLAEDVEQRGWSGPVADLSPNGVLAYLRGRKPEPRVPTWVDPATGASEPLGLPPAEYEQVRVSPVDDRQMAAVTKDGPDFWRVFLFNTATQQRQEILSTRVMRPRLAWSPDGEALVLASEKANGDFVNLYEVRLKQPGQMLRLTEQPLFGQLPVSWSPAGSIVFSEGVRPATKADLKLFRFADRSVTPLVETPGWDVDGVLSPDGQTLAYASDADGPMRVYLRPLRGGPALPVGEGRGPLWRDGGKTLLFARGPQLLSVPVSPGGQLLGPPTPTKALLQGNPDVWTRGYDLSSGGRVLSVVRPAPVATQATIVVLSPVSAALP